MGQACCPHDYSGGLKASLEEVRSGDVLLARDPAFRKAGACLAQSLLCWGVNHMGLAVDPGDFPVSGALRTKMPQLEPGNKYMLHALVSGIRVWTLEDYLQRMIDKGPPTGAIYIRQLLFESNSPDADRERFLSIMDSVFGKVCDKHYESNFGSMIAGYFDSCEHACSCCASKGDDNSYFCSELAADVYLQAGVLHDDRPADEFVPTDFLDSDGINIESTQFSDGYSLGPIHSLELPEAIDDDSRDG
mmetsp:Transcript_111424/g.175588  ORF Transcript_111424/g.175588 Transcript_111424/m.175588 type:complete len:247 (-) Transcript_111424:65-805(-)